jgi:hypothetical protein
MWSRLPLDTVADDVKIRKDQESLSPVVGRLLHGLVGDCPLPGHPSGETLSSCP